MKIIQTKQRCILSVKIMKLQTFFQFIENFILIKGNSWLRSNQASNFFSKLRTDQISKSFFIQKILFKATVQNEPYGDDSQNPFFIL